MNTRNEHEHEHEHNTPRISRKTLRRFAVWGIRIFGGITLAGILIGVILFVNIGKASGWEALRGEKSAGTYSKAQADKFITNVLIAVQNQPMEQAGAEADMLFIASFNAFEQRMTMAAISNDIVVDVEGHGKKTLGEAYALGGPVLLRDTMNAHFDLDIHNYACTTTHSLAAMIDLLGGIRMELTQEEAAYIEEALGESPVEQSAQTTLLSGTQSMVHAMDNRSRGEALGGLVRRLNLVNSAVKGMRATATKEAMIPLLSMVFSSIQTNLDIATLRDLGYEILRADEMEYRNLVLPDAQARKADVDAPKSLSLEILREDKQLREALYRVD
ncbi:LCP family protein [Christensenellaceae bacterium OttesenSCG-928-L17]|nr:LCP family protein [Christensenellaceae bacterium OttesenSCG-928-L17]